MFSLHFETRFLIECCMFIGPPGSLGMTVIAIGRESSHLSVKKKKGGRRYSNCFYFSSIAWPQEIELIELGENVEAIFFRAIVTSVPKF